MKLHNKTYDAVIPFGRVFSAAMYSIARGFRRCSLPFDWIGSPASGRWLDKSSTDLRLFWKAAQNRMCFKLWPALVLNREKRRRLRDEFRSRYGMGPHVDVLLGA